MDLKTYRYVNETTYAAMAKIIGGVNPEYLAAIGNGVRCSALMAIKIEKGLNFEVLRGDVRPDLWQPDTRKLVLSD